MGKPLDVGWLRRLERVQGRLWRRPEQELPGQRRDTSRD